MTFLILARFEKVSDMYLILVMLITQNVFYKNALVIMQMQL